MFAMEGGILIPPYPMSCPRPPCWPPAIRCSTRRACSPSGSFNETEVHTRVQFTTSCSHIKYLSILIKMFNQTRKCICNQYVCCNGHIIEDYKCSTSLMLSGLPLRSCLFIVSMAFFTNCSSLNSTTLQKRTQVSCNFSHLITLLMTIIFKSDK